VNPGVSDAQTDKAELRRQHAGFCWSMRTTGVDVGAEVEVDVGAACRARMGMYFASVVGSNMERMLGGRKLRIVDQSCWMLRF
jgi:hypothetical protein